MFDTADITAADADSVTPSTTTSQAYLQGVGGNLGATASSLSADSSVVVSKVPATPTSAMYPSCGTIELKVDRIK